MRSKRFVIAAGFIVSFAAWAVWCALAPAQSAAPPSIAEQLQAQYRLVRMGSDAHGTEILSPGTVLAIQKPEILGVPAASLVVCPSKYERGSLHSANAWCQGWVKTTSSHFQVGEFVYPSKIKVEYKNERIAFGIVACDTCNGTNPPTFIKGEVIFQFPKGYLKAGNVSNIEDAIGNVFSIDESADSQNSQPSEAAQPDQQQSQSATQPNQTSAPPQTVQLGDTPQQVQAILGQPDKTVDLGEKQIWLYKDLKVTFENGKMTDAR